MGISINLETFIMNYVNSLIRSNIIIEQKIELENKILKEIINSTENFKTIILTYSHIEWEIDVNSKQEGILTINTELLCHQ